MYPGTWAKKRPDHPAYVFAGSGETVTYRGLDEMSNRIAQWLRSIGLQTGDHVALIMENHPRFLQVCWAAQRSGLYYTPVNWHLTPAEMGYIVGDCGARVVFTTTARLAAVEQLRDDLAPGCRVVVVDDERSFEETLAGMPTTPVPDETEGVDMIYSSGTTGRPKGGTRALSGVPMERDADPVISGFAGLYQMDESSVYLTPGAPLYHAAPLRFSMAVNRIGGTNVILEQFDAEGALRAVAEHGVTHSQWVPTMFVRMLRLPEEVRSRYDLGSHRLAIHAAAPCSKPVKQAMFDWWGPILHEYYGASEGGVQTYIGPEDWLAHPGSVGKALFGSIHIVDDATGEELPPGESGVIWFDGGSPIKYHNDETKTAKAYDSRGRTTVGDMGYLDDDGYLYLTDRLDNMIIAGGVNIYPQEVEDVLLEHPAVADVAVFGVPHEELGEQVKAVVQPLDGVATGPELADELLAFCRERLASYKCPRSVDFEDQLPRSAAGKLYKRLVRDRYWQGRESSIV
ncbi:MAG TPA: acyl-CoA synthetase [Acidimicrobiales bacterium]|nr:acyl-CoA synthetase [Acidimicrobiales bacterium]